MKKSQKIIIFVITIIALSIFPIKEFGSYRVREIAAYFYAYTLIAVVFILPIYLLYRLFHKKNTDTDSSKERHDFHMNVSELIKHNGIVFTILVIVAIISIISMLNLNDAIAILSIVGAFFFLRYCYIKDKKYGFDSETITGAQYERKVAIWMRQQGYYNVNVTPISGDYGVDITACKGNDRYAIQCKLYNRPVGVSAIQEVVAGMAHYNCNIAMVITNSTFTEQARNLARDNGVILIDHLEL